MLTRRWFSISVFTNLVVAAWLSSACATTHTVTQVNLTFSPDALTVLVGDTVRWVHSSGSHTVTNGTGAADPAAGTLFDEALTAANPVVEYVFARSGETC